MEDTGSSETAGEVLTRRLAQPAGPNPRLEDRAVAEERILSDLINCRQLTANLPSALPDFIGSEHEVWSDGKWVIKASLPGAYGRLWGKRRFALPSEYIERISLTVEIFALQWEVLGITAELNRFRIISRQPFLKGTAPTHDEIETFMESFGFTRKNHRFGQYWWRPDDAIIAYDAEPGNFVKTSFGLVPVDLILQKEGESTCPEIIA